MSSKEYSILIIDDHPLITEAYITALNLVNKNNKLITFNVKVAQNCDIANDLINDFYNDNKKIDVVFLDIQLPPSKDGKIVSGEDLGIQINSLFPDVKIIVSTTLNNNFRVQSIFKSIDPDGFLIKNDITPDELVETINTVINDPPYYTKTVTKLLRKQVSNEFLLDDIDRKILYQLSIGTKTKDLPNILTLSLPGIEKRKRLLKHAINIKTSNDRELLNIAKEKGFI